LISAFAREQISLHGQEDGDRRVAIFLKDGDAGQLRLRLDNEKAIEFPAPIVQKSLPAGVRDGDRRGVQVATLVRDVRGQPLKLGIVEVIASGPIFLTTRPVTLGLYRIVDEGYALPPAIIGCEKIFEGIHIGRPLDRGDLTDASPVLGLSANDVRAFCSSVLIGRRHPRIPTSKELSDAARELDATGTHWDEWVTADNGLEAVTVNTRGAVPAARAGRRADVTFRLAFDARR
jgi:hypothetical protein